MKQIMKPMVTILCLAMIGCGGGAKSPGVTDTEILVGITTDVSGPLKELGALVNHGTTMYLDYVNSEGGVHGRNVKLLAEDAAYNPQKTVVAAKKLIEKDQVFCLYGTFGTSHTEALRGMIEENEIPLIAPTSQSGTLSDMSRPASKYIFHTDLGYDKQGEIMVDWAIKQNPDAKIGIIYQDDDYGENAVAGTEAAAARHGITVQKESFQRGSTDFTGQVRNVMKGGCDVVLIAAIVKEPIIIMKTAAAMGYKPQFMGFGPTMDHRVTLAAGEAGEGFISAAFAQLWDSDHPSAVFYREQCDKNNVPVKMRGMYHFYGFTTAHVLVEGLRRAGKNPTRKGMVRGLENLQNYEGAAMPSISYGPNDRAGAESAMLIQSQGGKQVPITGWLN